MRKEIKSRFNNIENLRVVDIGSYDMNGSFRSIMKESWKYIGVDKIAGPNVDILTIEDYYIPLESECVDLVISGSCLQFVKNPFKLIAEAYRLIVPGGTIIVYASKNEKEGLNGRLSEVVDCWAFRLAGMEAILSEAGFKVKENFYFNSTCWGIGVK